MSDIYNNLNTLLVLCMLLKAKYQYIFSILGTYYQASIFGEKVTWLVGHEQRSVGRLKTQNIDLPVMTTFTQFYTTMLKFINFRLYKHMGLIYPPQMAFEEENNCKLLFHRHFYNLELSLFDDRLL